MDPNGALFLPVDYFDGRSSRRLPANLSIADGAAIVEISGKVRTELLERVVISEPMGNAPRTVSFADGAFCEVRDGLAFAAMLARAGVKESAVVRLQSRWRFALVSFVGVVAVLTVAYLWLLPLAARAVAPRVPAQVAQAISTAALKTLDDHLLHPSRLSAARRERLAQGLARLQAATPEHPAYRLHFRSAPMIGANAFALPNGDIVVFDELVALADDDREVLAVAAHELGHVAKHHGMRQLMQSAVVSFVVGVYLGDVSTLASGMTTLALQSNYSREFEFEADRFGGLALLKSGGTTEPLARMLSKLEAQRLGRPAGAKESRGGGVRLSTHPDTGARIDALQALRL